MKKMTFPMLMASVLMTNPALAQINDPFFEPMMFNSPKIELHHQFSTPKMDVAEENNKIEIKVELPGWDENNVNLSCDNHVLTISGENKQSLEEKDKNYYLKETSSGSFSRSVRLPQNIDEDKIEAVFKNGVLNISIPKTEDKKETAKKITIKKGE